MFYQYSYPVQFYQHLHNKLASVIIKTGQLLGLIWFKSSSDGYTLTPYSTSSRILSIIAILYQIWFLIYMPYYLNYVNFGSNVVSETLVTISYVLYSAVVIFMYGIAFFRQKLVLKLMNFSMYLLKCSYSGFLVEVENYRKSLVLHLATKIVIDMCSTLSAMFLFLYYFVMHPKIITFLGLFSETVTMAVYCFITTVYYISFAFGLFYVKRLSANVNDRNLQVVSFRYQEIHKYVREINGLMSLVMCFLLFTGFIALVGEVSILQMFH